MGRNPERFWASVVPRLTQQVIYPIIREKLGPPNPNLIILTDGSNLYPSLKTRLRYDHRAVIHVKYPKRKKKQTKSQSITTGMNPINLDQVLEAEVLDRESLPTNLGEKVRVRGYSYDWPNDDGTITKVNTCKIDRFWQTLKSDYIRPRHSFIHDRFQLLLDWCLFQKNHLDFFELISM